MFSLLDAAKHLRCDLLLPDPSVSAEGASIDTRTISAQNLFIALPGQNTDGHDFLQDAFIKGACGALVSLEFAKALSSEAKKRGVRNLLAVDNPEAAFAELASWHRSRSNACVVGITGSVGKTSTKEFLRYLLSLALGDEKKVLATKGNLNNHLGVPLTLMNLREEHEYCLCEMGANHPGDIAALCRIAHPDAGVLTPISSAHLEGFGSLEKIYETKLELAESLRKGSLFVVPAEDDCLDVHLKRFLLKIRSVGFNKGSYRVSSVSSSEEGTRFAFGAGGQNFRFPGQASFLALNAGLALAFIESRGLDIEKIPLEWNTLRLPDGRFTVLSGPKGSQLIYDGYNASPKSFSAALKALAEHSAKGSRYLVFSDMLELGESSERLHRQLADDIAAAKLDGVIAYGNFAALTIDELKSKAPGTEAHKVESPEEAAELLLTKIHESDLVLFKASRGMKIERAVSRLQASETV